MGKIFNLIKSETDYATTWVNAVVTMRNKHQIDYLCAMLNKDSDTLTSYYVSECDVKNSITHEEIEEIIQREK